EEGTPLHVLQGIDGTLRPGTMTLVLAPPGHGKSAFLQALGGRISGEGVTGKVTYGGLTADEVPGSLNKLVAYMPQHDEHMALLTVRETLNFALKNAVVANEGLLQDAGAVKAMVRRVDTVLKLLGLEECAETYVGNDLVRGVSGGQRKRISIGELLITNARVTLLDEYSTGLDTSTTFDITNALRQWTRHMGGVLGASLLQPTPEVYALFDDIVLLREGAVVFHGPRHLLRPFFEAAGWVIPPTVDEADWLVEMLTDPPAMWAKAQQPGVTPSAGPGAPPLTTADMVTAWRASDLCSRLSAAARGQDVPPGPPGPPSEASDAEEGAGSAEESSGAASQEDGAGSEESADAQAHTKSDWLAGYSAPALALQSAFANQQFGTGATQSWGAHFALNLSRQWSLLTRNPMYMAGKLMDNCLMGAALGSLFWQLPQESAVGRLGAVVFGLVLAAFSNFAVIPSAIEARNVIQKQDRLGFYPMSSYVAATAVMHLPVAALESMALSALIYFMPGFVNDAGRFLFFYLFIFMTDMLFAMVFQVLTYVSPNMEAAQSLSAPLVSLFLLFAGLLNTRSSIPDFMIWMYWLSPFAWSTRAVAQNEFLSSEYDAAVPGTDKNFGQVLLERFEVQTEEDYQWAGVVFNLAMYVLAFGLTVLAISKVRFDVAIGTARPTKADEEAAPQAVPEVRPVPPKTLTFADLGYTVKLKDGTERALLTNVNGVMRPGTCTALCGVSGAGKSTLLDVLAGRKTAGKQTGQVFVNGQVQDPLTFARITAYVEQESLLMDHATVLESVQFAAALRLDPEAVDAATRETIVTEVMSIMELNPLADRIVGEAGTRNALSPSQRKLLSIAIELVSQPSILFLDEPTSGLDS
ncbi:ABCG31, partial [Symbiodinium sp. KB8]